MTAAYASIGANGTGTTSAAPTTNVGTAAGDLLILVAANKYPANGPAAPAGYTLLGQASGGAGAAGADSGNVYCSVFYKVSDGTDSGATLSVTCAGGNSLYTRVLRYTKASNETWYISVPSVGSNNTAGASWSVTGDVSLDVAAGDLVLAVSAINTDTYTYSAEAVAISGVVMGTATERNDVGTNQGDDCASVTSEHVVTSGASAGAPTYTMTASGTAGNGPAGATVMFRLRAAVPSTVRASSGTKFGIHLGI